MHHCRSQVSPWKVWKSGSRAALGKALAQGMLRLKALRGLPLLRSYHPSSLGVEPSPTVRVLVAAVSKAAKLLHLIHLFHHGIVVCIRGGVEGTHAVAAPNHGGVVPAVP